MGMYLLASWGTLGFYCFQPHVGLRLTQLSFNNKWAGLGVGWRMCARESGENVCVFQRVCVGCDSHLSDIYLAGTILQRGFYRLM